MKMPTTDSMKEISPRDIKVFEKQGYKITYLDTRNIDLFEIEHIREAIHLPYKMIDQLNTSGLDKSSLYMLYYKNLDHDLQVDIWDKMNLMGFKSYFLKGGIDRWKAEGLPTASLKRKKFCCGRGCGC